MEPISRAGLKLEAALQRFGLVDRIRGAAAVDVGSSTGGFTACLLQHGAARVTAVDVGHKQLHESLRRDSRVESVEGTDWKTLPLAQLPGPFDFFTVDVSFVAARSMLRSLAFRLRDGAEGVVLVKPQFELPDSQVRGGKVDDPNLRRLAIDRFTSKAVALGFEAVAVADSPVTGGSGTVEMLAHLRFAGRSAVLPQPGERRPARPTRAGKPVVADTLRWFAVSAPGLEEVTEAEVARIPGVTKVQRLDGGVEWSGPLQVGLRANLWLRSATRVVARVGEVRAREFGKMRRLLAGLPWELFIAAGSTVKVSATTSRCRLYHTGALAETILLAVDDRIKPKRSQPAAAATSDTTIATVLVRGIEDAFTISVDSSGERLHRRGWRLETAVAPLRETLAVGLLALCEWNESMALCDPMCGAGTIPLEACAWGLNVAPGLRRSFGFEAWPLFRDTATTAGGDVWQRLRGEAQVAIRAQLPAPISGSDRNPEAIASAQHNAQRAGFESHLQLRCADIGDARPTAPHGLVLLNPPYGRRLGNERTLGRLYRDIGRALRAHFRGWRAGLVVANRATADAIGMPVTASHRLTNGGIPITLLRYNIQ
ncbi:MAG TPA: SAM-dependent methyltransferase [Polyangia bacterium]|jgi:putative N6-adenine-specific DNA methylase|nr:SAM-dependent methyltransferase [Polyangia bacterium]